MLACSVAHVTSQVMWSNVCVRTYGFKIVIAAFGHSRIKSEVARFPHSNCGGGAGLRPVDLIVLEQIDL